MVRIWLISFFLLGLGVTACRDTQTVVGQQSEERQPKNEAIEPKEKGESTQTANNSRTKLKETDELREINNDSSDRVLSAVGEVTTEQSRKLSKLFDQMLNEKATKECLKEKEGLEKERLREIIGVLKIDLNDDGVQDYVLSNGVCGGSSNFPTFVYKSEKNGTYKGFYIGDLWDLEVTKNKTDGYYDLIAMSSSNVNVKYIFVYKYRKGKYQIVRCGVAETVKTADGKEERQIMPEKCSISN